MSFSLHYKTGVVMTNNYSTPKIFLTNKGVKLRCEMLDHDQVLFVINSFMSDVSSIDELMCEPESCTYLCSPFHILYTFP